MYSERSKEVGFKMQKKQTERVENISEGNNWGESTEKSNRTLDRTSTKSFREKIFDKRRKTLLSKEESKRWMLRSLIFIPLLALFDYLYRTLGAKSDIWRVFFMMLCLACVGGILSGLFGLYFWLKNWANEEAGN